MPKHIDLDAEFDLAEVRESGQLVLQVLNRAHEIWQYLPIDKRQGIVANSVTFKGIAKLKRSLDRFGGLGEGD